MTATQPIGAASSGPLAGITVADFTRVLAGPYCTMLLADLGADVIKIEPPGGEDARYFRPPTFEDESAFYLAVNRNKRSIALDLRSEADATVARDIARRCDVFVHNFKPGDLERYDLHYEGVQQENPGVVYCGISGFGTGGGASLPGYDLMAQAISGMIDITGHPDGPGTRAGIALFDVMTGLHSAVAVLAALNHRGRTGEGQRLETNLLSVALSSMANQAASYAIGNTVPVRVGNAQVSLYPYAAFPTSDGELIVIAANDRQFATLSRALEMPELATDPRFAKAVVRNDNRDLLKPILEARLATRTSQEWFAVLTDAGLPCAPINDVRGGFEFAERIGLDPVVDVDGVPGVRNPVTYYGSPVRYDHRPPLLDADGDLIRAWASGQSTAGGLR